MAWGTSNEHEQKHGAGEELEIRQEIQLQPRRLMEETPLRHPGFCAKKIMPMITYGEPHGSLRMQRTRFMS